MMSNVCSFCCSLMIHVTPTPSQLSLDNNLLTGGFEPVAKCLSLHYLSICGNPISDVAQLAPLVCAF